MIEIVPYRDVWAAEFTAIAARVRAALGDRALRVDHIGSTSVPGLAAKDVIDVQLTVAALEPRVVDALTRAAYACAEEIRRDHRPPGCHGPETDWEKLYFRPPPGQRRAHLHVRVTGRANQRYALLFRDYLRAHPQTRDAYGELKQRLAQNLADASTYPDVKDPAVDLIYFAAEDWAVATGWRPGSSDG